MLLQVDIWPVLLENGLPLVLMGLGVYWLIKQIEKKDAKIDELQSALRADQKENLTLLLKFEKVLDKIIDSTANTEITVVRAVQGGVAELKDHVSSKIQLLKEALRKNDVGPKG